MQYGLAPVFFKHVIHFIYLLSHVLSSSYMDRFIHLLLITVATAVGTFLVSGLSLFHHIEPRVLDLSRRLCLLQLFLSLLQGRPLLKFN